MSMRTAPPRPPVGLADLDAALQDWSQAARRGLWVDRAWTAFVLFVLVGLNGFTVFGQDRRAVLIVCLTIVAVLTVRGGALLVSWDRDRREGAPAGRGPSSLTTVRSLAPGAELWSAVRGALGAAGLSSQWLIDAHTLSATRPPTLTQRHLVTVRVVPADGGGALVTVWARPEVSWWSRASPDFGRSRRLANAVLNAIPGATPLS